LNITVEPTIDNSPVAKSCLKKKLKIGPEWFEMLTMSKDLGTLKRKKLIEKIVNVFQPVNESSGPERSLRGNDRKNVKVNSVVVPIISPNIAPKHKEEIENFTLKHIESNTHSFQDIHDEVLNSIDFNVSKRSSSYIHTKTSRVSFNWKVQQRIIPNFIYNFTTNNKIQMSYPINDTLLKIATGNTILISS
jgi:predicted small metal-binding protein